MSETDEVDRRYLDPALSVDDRVDVLLPQLTAADKAGLMFHTMMLPNSDLDQAAPAFGLPSPREYVLDRRMNHFNLLGPIADPAATARWHNAVQQLAASTRLQIPVTFSTDPRHAFVENPGTSFGASAFSQWPEAIGLAAIGDEVLVERFGDIARQEYLCVGIRVALHPQIDLATEPRWARQSATFGEDAELTSRLVVGYVRGFQTDRLGPDSVATMTKHFPGGGPQLDGEDPHFPYGREQVYPGGQQELHLRPFRAALEAGTSQIMPYYGMPVGTDWEEVGFGFNRDVITGLLRDQLGFDGIVCTDWGLINDAVIMGDEHVARAWGVESLSPRERMIKALEAGVDQFGGEADTALLTSIIEAGEVGAERIDASVRRLLREKFVLGLFDRREVDPDAATATAGRADFVAAGLEAQRASVTVLANRTDDAHTPVLPIDPGARIYLEGIDPRAATDYGTVVDDPAHADVALVSLPAPFEPRTATAFEGFFHAGSLDFPKQTVDHLADLAAKTTLVVAVGLDRPAILTEIDGFARGLVATFGVSPQALLDVLFGRAVPRGRLPFDLPRSMAAVEESRPDVPFDTADPLYRHGHGLPLG